MQKKSDVPSLSTYQPTMSDFRPILLNLPTYLKSDVINGRSQTLLHLSRHSKVFLLRPSLFVRNSHKKTRWWASSLFFSSAAKEKKYADAHSGVRRTQVGRNAQIGVNGAAGLLVSASSFSTSDGMKWRNPKYNGLETRIFFKK